MNNVDSLFAAWKTNPTEDNKADLWIAVFDETASMTSDADLHSETVIHVITTITRNGFLLRGKLRHYISTALRNAQINEEKKIREELQDTESLDQLSADLKAPTPVMLDLDAIPDCLDRMLAELLLENKTIKEAAAELNMKPSAARMRLRRLGEKLGDVSALLLF